MDRTTIDLPGGDGPAAEVPAVRYNARYTATTALVVVDVQNDFADPEGSLAVAGAEALIPVINREIRRARSSHSLVVATQDWHPESTPHFQKDGGIWPVHCVGGTWGAQLHPDLRLPEDAHTIRKGVNGEDGYSGFTTRDPVSGEERPTGLDRLLRDHGTTRVVVIGLATDYCVQATALDAARLGYDAAVLVDACAAVDLEAGDGDRALVTMRDADVAILRTRMR